MEKSTKNTTETIQKNDTHCHHENCTSLARKKGGFCKRHGGSGRKKCIYEDCTKFAIAKNGLCKKHGGGKRCTYEGCKKSAAQGGSELCISHGGGKRCTYESCIKLVRDNTEFCVEHGGGKRCTKDSCTKLVKDNTPFCTEHGGGKRCIHGDCKKLAADKTNLCVGHGGGQRCKKEGCTKGVAKGGKSEFCVKHGGGKRCNKEGCTKGVAKGGKSEFCVKHGGGKRCNNKGCTKGACGNTDLCVEHGGGKRCNKDGCIKGASDNTDFCIEHGGGHRCPYCKDWPDSKRGVKKYDGYCASCFKHVFPKDPRSSKIRGNSHETKVRNYLNENMKGFIHNTPIYTADCDCTHRRRIDHRIMIGNTILAVETDERQHIGYLKSDETIRYDDVYMVHSGKWVFIRFNPDSYTKNGIRYNPDITKRLPILLSEIKRQIERIMNELNKEPLEIIKLFYDE